MITRATRIWIVVVCTLLGSSLGGVLWSQDTQTSAPSIPSDSSAVTLDATVSTGQPVQNAEPTSNDALVLKTGTSKRVTLNFRDEDWLPALQWLAKELQLNLDYQLLPEGKLSLFSSNDYALEEAEDLVNMQLLGRGFTLLKRGEVLRLVPMKEIDITLVPRVSVDDLDALAKHQVVRVSIPLEWMLADKAATEFKPLLSPYGQMFPLASSNRLEVLDAVVNLRELCRLIARAESEDGRRVRVMEFRLKYRKAAEIAIQVRQLIGLPADGTPAVSTQTQLDIEQARFKAEAVKQLGTNARELLTDKKQDTFLVVNEKENSIVVNAPPDKLEMVKQTVETLDKPLPETDSSWQTVSRVKVHPVNGFDPEAISRLLLALQERGNLAKETRIQHEAAYNRIIAFASPEDHLTISQLIESYRAEKRSASVIPLSTVSPAYAVKAIQLILKNPERPSTAPGVASDGKFQIEADSENNRLLLWATSDELKEVREFLISLGETFESGPVASSQMHIVSVGAGDVAAVTDRLREVWREVSDAPLVIERKPGLLPDSSQRAVEPMPAADVRMPEARLLDKSEANVRLVSSTDQSDDGVSAPGVGGEVEHLTDRDDKQTQPPVRVIEGKKGDLVIVSRDPDAAVTAKKLIQQLVPDPGDVRVIQLKHAQALSIRRQLESMLASTAAATPASKLASPTPGVVIEVDSRTNRLIIQHCSARQLELINKYVPLLDQATDSDGRMNRQQKVYRAKHRRANEIAEVIKEVYRDLLSINDRVFSSGSSYRPSGYNQNLAATATNPEYQGLMSLGIDAESNLLVISAPGYLIEEVTKLAESVDTEVDGPAMAVIPAAGDTSDIKLREALSKILKKR